MIVFTDTLGVKHYTTTSKSVLVDRAFGSHNHSGPLNNCVTIEGKVVGVWREVDVIEVGEKLWRSSTPSC